MANPNKAKGTRFETEVTTALNDAGIKAIKPRQAGALDIGDIHVEDDVVLQAKAWTDYTTALNAGTKGATIQAERARRAFGVAVIKKPRGAILDAYVVMPLSTFIRFLRR